MVSFLVYDLIFLAAFLVFFTIFLRTRRHNLKRDGLLILYRTSWGIRIINYIGKKYKKTIGFLSYVSIATGYLLIIGVFYLIYTILKIYLFNPDIVRAIKIPPILPLVPYLPQVFSLDFLPPFFFTYWIVIIAIVAISHEMAHGIFMRRYNIKIKSTGFAFFPWFLPIFPAAFVEQDEKSMMKAKRSEQMAVLSAGTFANVITAIIFFVILILFFSLAFSPSGVVFDSYATSTIAIVGISSVNGIPVTAISYQELLDEIDKVGGERFSEIVSEENEYLINSQILESQEENEGTIIVYNSAPAIRENLSSIITEINSIKIDSFDKLISELGKYSPGEEIVVTTIVDEGFKENTIVLEEHPGREGQAWLGIGFFDRERGGFFGNIIDKFSSFREPHVHYEPKFDGMSLFIYNLLWWMVLISVSVALINMLPVGIFDGGRFFYLTVLAITKNEKLARKLFSFSTSFFLFLLLLLMVFWVISFVR